MARNPLPLTRQTLRNQGEKGRALSLAKDQIWREAAARAFSEVQTLRTKGIHDIATVAAVLFVPAKKTCSNVSLGFRITNFRQLLGTP